MGVLNIVKTNFLSVVRTLKPDDKVECHEKFRGLVIHEAGRCTACQTCGYVCSPGAITFNNEHEQFAIWEYDAGQCTFCGRCIQYCPTEALKFDPKPAPVCTTADDLQTAHEIHYTVCTRCGDLFVPLPGSLLNKLYGEPLAPDIIAIRSLCDSCRNRVTTRNLKEAARGQLAKRASDHIDRLAAKRPQEEENDGVN